jgi:hypothetical protein
MVCDAHHATAAQDHFDGSGRGGRFYEPYRDKRRKRRSRRGPHRAALTGRRRLRLFVVAPCTRRVGSCSVNRRRHT